MSILLLEDDKVIRETVAEYLILADFEVHKAATFGEAEVILDRYSSQLTLAILDVQVPGGNGFLLGKEIRKSGDLPVFFLTARDDENSRIAGFEIGADDYIVKPFSPRELVLRVEALHRRSAEKTTNTQKTRRFILQQDQLHDELHVQVESQRVYCNDKELLLTPSEWGIIEMFTAHPGIVLSRDRVESTVLGYHDSLASRSLDTHMANLRTKLGGTGWIQTLRGKGYRFLGEPSD